MNRVLTLFLFLLTICSFKMNAQKSFSTDKALSKKELKKHGCRKAYLGVGVGINTQSGLIGAQFDYTLNSTSPGGLVFGLGFSWGVGG